MLRSRGTAACRMSKRVYPQARKPLLEKGCKRNPKPAVVVSALHHRRRTFLQCRPLSPATVHVASKKQRKKCLPRYIVCMGKSAIEGLQMQGNGVL